MVGNYQCFIPLFLCQEGGKPLIFEADWETDMRKSIYLVAAAMLAATGVSAAPTKHLVGAELLSKAKISLAQARRTALAAHPGVVTDQELENESGGTGLRYSFDIKNKGKTFEVGVDARTGKVLENKAEGRNPD